MWFPVRVPAHFSAVARRIDGLRVRKLAFESWWWVVPVIWLMAALGMPELNASNLWYDEVWSLKAVGADPYPRHSFGEIWQFLAEKDPQHPPVYFMMLGAWGRLVGWTPFAGRMLSLVWGLLAVAMVYRLGGTLFTRRAGFFAAGLLSSSAFLVYYAHELRAYTWLTFLTVFTLWVYWQVINRTGRAAWIARAGLFGAMSSLIYTNYFGCVPFVAVGMWHLTRRPWNRPWRHTAFTIAAAGATFLPWIAVLRVSYETYAGLGMPSPRMTPGEMLTHAGYTFSNTHLPLLMIPLIFALVVAAAASGQRVRRVWFLLIVMMLTYMALNLQIKVLIPQRFRYFIPLWPVLALLVGVGFDRLSRRVPYPVLLLLILWIGVGIWRSPGLSFARTLEIDGWWAVDWSAMTSVVAENEHEGDVLAVWTQVNVDDEAFDYYTRPLGIPAVFESIPGAERQLVTLTTSAQRLWVAYDLPPTIMSGLLGYRLRSDYAFCGAYPAGDYFNLILYIRPPADLPVRFGAGVLPVDGELQLDLIAPVPAVVQDRLPVDLIWMAEAGIVEQTVTAVLSLVDENGGVVLEKVVDLPDVYQICTREVFDLSAVVPGVYQVQVGVLFGDTLLPGYVRGAGYPVERVILGSVAVPE